MDTAVDVTGDVDCTDNGTWSYTWSWRYAGDEVRSDVHEEFLIVHPRGAVVDFVQEPHHEAEPGMTYIGGGVGAVPLPPGSYHWKLHVISADGIIGWNGGDFFAATDPIGDDPGLDPVTPSPGGGGSGGGGGPATGEVREPTLRRDDQSADGWVEYLQELLSGYGLGPLVVDGNFGGATHRAVTAFQGRNGLLVDGVVGNQTWSALRHETPQAPGTDGRRPHSQVEHGAEARWWTEIGPAAYDAGADSIVLPAINTGIDPLGTGFVATATLTPAGGAPVPFALHSFTGDGQPSAPGGYVYFGNRGVAALTGTGQVVLDALLPNELGGDNIQVTITVP